MRLHSLVVEHFRAIRSATLTFGHGLNLIHGPNDLGKSTLTEAVRAVLLVAPASAEARSFPSWGAASGQHPKVVLTFECQGATWKVEKVFGTGSKAKAYLEKSTDGGARYHTHAEGRDVEGRIRELLSWGLPVPGGRGPSQRTETYLTTALLGKQGDVSAIFDASLKSDPDETGRALITRALDALGQDPVVTRLLERLKARSDEAYTSGGRHKRSADAPLVRARDELREREERLRTLEESARQGKDIEDQTRLLLQTRDAALDARDQAVVKLKALRANVATADRRQQLDTVIAAHLREFERVTAALAALETARQDYASAQADLTVAAEEQTKAADAASVADADAQVARDRLARARSAHESSAALASSARDLRVSDLRARMEKAAMKKKAAQEAVAAATELVALESQVTLARAALDEAQREMVRASAEVSLSTVLEELERARVLSDAVDAAAVDHEKQLTRERAAAAMVAKAEEILKVSITMLETARSAEEQARRAVDEYAKNVSLLETRILHSEAGLRDERDALERATTVQLRVRRADEAEAALAAADMRMASVEGQLVANESAIAHCQTELRALGLVDLGLRRRTLVSQVDELTILDTQAHEQRHRAVEARENAGRLEAEAFGRQLPSSQELAAQRTLQSEIQRRKTTSPTVPRPSMSLPLLVGIVGALIGFAASRYGAAASTAISVDSAVVVGIAAALVAALLGSRQQKASAHRTWQSETDRLEAQLKAKTAEVLLEAGVGHIEEIEARRQQLDTLRADAERLRQEAVDLDRRADAMFANCTDLFRLQHELGTLIDALAAKDSHALMSRAAPFTDDRAALEEMLRSERERLEQAHRVAEQLRAQRDEQSIGCAAARAQLDNAVAERGEVPAPIDPAAAVAEAESRWVVAQTQLEGLRQERQRLVDLPSSHSREGFEIAVSRAKTQVALAETDLGKSRQERQAVVDDLARVAARLEFARRDADAVSLSDLQQHSVAAQAAAGLDVNPPALDAARLRYEQATGRVSSVSATVEHLNAVVASALRKAEALASPLASDPATELVNAENEEHRLETELLQAQGESAQQRGTPSEQELQDAQQAAARAEKDLIDTRARANAATARRDDLRARAERARGDIVASERQTQGMDVAEVQRALTEARETLTEVPPVPAVTPEALAQAERTLENRDHDLTACESGLNEARGQLALVAGKIGLERLDDERDAVARAREYAEDQEFEYEASRYLLESLEAAEATRSSHLGRSLATPVAERFLSLTGDLYAHVNLDPDLRLEGIVASGGTHGVTELSVGTREQLATIVRLAIGAQIKTTVLLDDQLVHSDSGRLEWFRTQLRNNVREHDHQVIIMTCRLADYAFDDELLAHEGEPSTNGRSLTIINILNVVQRVGA